MDILFSTVFRYAPVDEAGELVKVDWSKKQVTSKVSVAPQSLKFHDPNPRGNSRGGRGIAVVDNKVIVAGYCELQVYDLELNHLYNITHPLMASLHEVFLADKERLWVTSTLLNGALLIDLNTGHLLDQVWPQEISAFQERWKIAPLVINKNEDNRILHIAKNLEKDRNHLHFNAIASHKGELYGLFNRFGAVVNLSRETVVFEDRSIYGAHNLIIRDDGTIFINDTRNQAVNMYNLDGSLIKRIDLLPFHKARTSIKLYKRTESIRNLLKKVGIMRHGAVMPFFVRGMDVFDNQLFVGISPAAVLCVDWQKEVLIDWFDYSNDARIAVHGLHII